MREFGSVLILGHYREFLRAVLPFVPWIVVFCWLISLSDRVSRLQRPPDAPDRWGQGTYKRRR